MDAPNKIYVEVCEDGIFAFPEPPFKESVEYIRAELVGQSLQQEQPKFNIPSAGSGAWGTTPPKFKLDVKPVEPEVDLEKEIYKEWGKCYPTDEGMGDEKAILVSERFHQIARHFAEWGRKQVLQEIYEGKVKPVTR